MIQSRLNAQHILIVLSMILIVSCSQVSNKKGMAVNGQPEGMDKTMVKEVSSSMNTDTFKPYVLKVGDRISVKFYYDPELNEELVIRPDGMISLQLINEVKASGLTPMDLQTLLKNKYSTVLTKPELTVITQTFASEKIFVGGEVNTPGMIQIAGDMTAFQAIMQAGGYKKTGELSSVVVIRKPELGNPVFITLNLDAESYPQKQFNDVMLQAHDVVFIPRSTIAKLGQFVDMYFNQLVPVSLNMGFSWLYELNDKDN
ncbi:MAG: polysaccharide export protein [Desulfobacteraceae bacterium]|nr:polysaccharide export protein [Desulfobacteraceae bacterium]